MSPSTASPILRGAACFAALVLVIFGDVLVRSDAVLSHGATDVAGHFWFSRQFGFSQLAGGNLPLWNPHICGGYPYLGSFQSALLYLPNWLYMVVSPVSATNWIFAFHFFLIGFSMYLLGVRRGLHPVASGLAGIVLMLGGPVFMRLWAGHVTILTAMSWTPMLLLAVDEILERPGLRPAILFSVVLGMQILSGHPQTSGFTLVAFGIYALMRSWQLSRRLGDRAVMGALAILGTAVSGGLALAAVQLLPAWEAAGESVRSGGAGFAFVSSFSLPPENLVTLVAPWFFGDMGAVPYWGRSFLWEMQLFVGVSALALITLGVMRGTSPLRWTYLAVAGILLVLSLGSRSPFFPLMYHYLPGFDLFRASCRFDFQALVFLALLAGMGMDSLLRAPDPPRGMIYGLDLLGACACVSGVALRVSPEPVSWLMRVLQQSGECYLAPELREVPGFLPGAESLASTGLIVAGVTAILAARLLARGRAWMMAMLTVVELVCFARTARPTFDPRALPASTMAELVRQEPGDHRISWSGLENTAMITGARDLWGYEPAMLRRYRELVDWTQTGDPAKPAPAWAPLRPHPLWRMLRARWYFPDPDPSVGRVELPQPLPRFSLLRRWISSGSREETFRALAAADFDPTTTVVLESEPVPVPDPARGGAIQVLDLSTDHASLRVELPSAAILLVTDAYSRGWVARPLEGSGQEAYTVMPANHALMAIPLAAGEHRLRLQYAPASFARGAMISVAAMTMLALSLIVSCWNPAPPPGGGGRRRL